MRKVLIGATVSALLAGGLMVQPAQAKAKTKAAAAPTCPACKMTLSTKKTKNNPQAVKINGKTYYCCAKCDMNKKK